MNIQMLRQARDAFRAGELAQSHTPAWFASEVDAWIQSACAGLLQADGSTLVLALGGYGRRELYPFSDIDLLICLPDSGAPDSQGLAEALFLPLWDNGFDVGHGIRTVPETLELACGDYEVFCSLLDARLLFGSVDVFDNFRSSVCSALSPDFRSGLIAWLRDRHGQRHVRAGETAHLLSPNLKEGRGGQRDLQTIHWLEIICAAKDPFLSASERAAVDRDAHLLGRVRTALHRASRRKNDVLHLEMQPELAQTLGYGPATGTTSVETFLSELHRGMAEISLLCRLSLTKARALAAGLSMEHADAGLDFSILAEDPANILELFLQSARRRIPIGWQTRRTIQDRFPVLAASDGWQVPVMQRFESILCGDHAGPALEQMIELGFLRLFLPEFAAIEHLVQFDAYHRLPAGYHLVETVAQLAGYGVDNEFLGEVLHPQSDDLCLRWAALLHDIGKGGDDHSRRGAVMARDILRRFGYSDEVVEECAFLIENHLLLVHTATRRDLGEESVIHGLAATLASVQRLDSLLLLTWADSVATGPKAWNPWVANLLRETYFKTRKVLEYGFLSDQHRVHRLSRLRDSLRSERPEMFSVHQFEGFLSAMPPRYLMQTSPKRIIEHIGLVSGFRAEPARPFRTAWEPRPGSRSLRLTLVSTDRPGLFARVCAALARHNLSVLGAELCVWEDRTVVDVFWVTEPVDLLYADEIMEAFEGTLSRLFEDEAELDKLPVQVASRMKKIFTLDTELVQVHIDNQASDFHSVLSLQAPDIPGLLATVSLSLYRLGIDLVFAKIATQKDKAMDILHIREGGEKIPDAQCEDLCRSLRLLIGSLYV